MSSTSTDERLVLPNAVGSVPDARHWAGDQLARSGTPHEQCDIVMLIVSELVTNAVQYGSGDIVLRLTSSLYGPVRVAVSDSGGGRPRLRSPAPLEHNGRGLLIIDRLSMDWGTVPSAVGTTVWAIVGPPAHASSGR